MVRYAIFACYAGAAIQIIHAVFITLFGYHGMC
jgi:hypothetical protein